MGIYIVHDQVPVKLVIFSLNGKAPTVFFLSPPLSILAMPLDFAEINQMFTHSYRRSAS
jgi:hypothetical protein